MFNKRLDVNLNNTHLTNTTKFDGASIILCYILWLIPASNNHRYYQLKLQNLTVHEISGASIKHSKIWYPLNYTLTNHGMLWYLMQKKPLPISTNKCPQCLNCTLLHLVSSHKQSILLNSSMSIRKRCNYKQEFILQAALVPKTRVSVIYSEVTLLSILYTWVRASWIEFNNCPTRCDLFSLLYFCRQLYMFRVLTPIIRGLYNRNYIFSYWLTKSTTICSHCWVGTQQRERMVEDPVNQYQKL